MLEFEGRREGVFDERSVAVSGSDQAMDPKRDKRVEANSKARVRTDGGVVGMEGGQRGKSG